MKIQIYGSGCDKCKKLYANAEAAAKSAGVDAELEKITDMDAIVAAGVMMTPALAVDGKVVSSGKVLSPDEIAPFIGSAPQCACAGATASDTACNCRSGLPMKRIVTVALLLFVLVSIGIMVNREVKSKAPAPAAATPVKTETLTVYYFHGDRRCVTCNKIEDMARKAVEEKFAPEMAAGTIVFKSVNVDEPENEHFVRDFGLDSKIVVMQKGDRVEKFQDVWALVGTPEKFTAYIQNGMEQMK